MKGGIKDLEVESSSEDESEEQDFQPNKQQSSKSSGGMFSMFKSLVGNKSLKEEDMQPILEKFKDQLIAKNVAAEIAQKLCDSLCVKLEGKVIGTFGSITNTIKSSLNDALVQILSPKRRIDILRDAFEAKKNKKPYVMTFCGVNGVGKSTNLAKICFWLIENNFRVLIAACDTFRAGAVEQLRTHMRHLNALHPPEKHNNSTMVQLYEKGDDFFTCTFKISNSPSISKNPLKLVSNIDSFIARFLSDLYTESTQNVLNQLQLLYYIASLFIFLKILMVYRINNDVF